MCKNHKFVQLHLHTSASLLDGVTNYKKVIKQAIENGNPAIAITDHGNPSNIFQFSKECKKQGIKPILGLEFYITDDLTSRISHKERTIETKDFHQSVYIKNKEGYINYNYLTYIAHTDGFYYKPRIDFKLLFEKKEGLMITTSCMASKISTYILNNNHKEAEDFFKTCLYEFKDSFYGEIQFNEVEGQKAINDFIIHLCKKYNVPVIIGGDVHYNSPEDNELQDAVIRSKRDASGEDWVISARKLFFHDTLDYFAFNKELDWNYDEEFIIECFKNSVDFSEKINFEFETGKYHTPKIDTGDMSSKDYLEKVTWEGIIKNIETERKYFPDRYTNEKIDLIEKQVKYELGVINDLEINDYMLIVYDIIKWEKENGLYVGPGRGSCAASLVAYGLSITSLNPLEHGLIFERFVNPGRKTMADIDWDSEQGAREKILEYLIGKYGRDSVCSVPTFGTYGPKSGLQSMSRGLRKDTGHDTVLMKKISKLDELNDLKKSWSNGEMIPYFKNLREKSTDEEIITWIDNNQDTIDFANRLQGNITNIGTHAGGIVVTPKPIYNYIPVTKSSSNLVAAFQESDGSAKDLGELGILKLDVLGLKTLNIIKECVNRILKDTGEDLTERINFLDLEDKKLIEEFAKGNNYGIFQMEKSKMFTSKMNVDCFQDIVAINAMNRPGPLEKYLEKYGYWKDIDKGTVVLSKTELEKVNKERYPFPFMEKSLKSTYGALLYQEQFMLLVSDMTGMSFGEADSFRRAIAWKEDHPKYYTVKGYFERLETSMIEKGYTKEDVDGFVKYCRDFMGYSFNLAHSLSYSYIAYQTLFLKYYYPSYFYAAMINIASNIDEVQIIIADAKLNNLEILPQSVKESEYLTRASDLKTIQLGFGMIKGMGESTINDCNSLRSYTSVKEIFNAPLKGINKTQYQNLIDLGAFDDYNIDRDILLSLKNLYQDEKIQDWFTRKKQPLRLETLPKSFIGLFEAEECLKLALKAKNEIEDAMWSDEPTTQKPWDLLLEWLLEKIKVKELDKKLYLKITTQKQKELMGFSLGDAGLSEIASTLKVKGLLPLKEYDDETKKYFFIVEKIDKALTKTGKTYLKLTLNNGIKAKCWKDINLIEGEIYYSLFKKDNFGYTLNDRECIKAL